VQSTRKISALNEKCTIGMLPMPLAPRKKKMLPSKQPMSKQILVIDDEDVILEVIQTCLETLTDWQVQIAESGKSGIEIARSHRPDGILLDISMPTMDGFEVLRQLQAIAETKAIPVILLTARAQPEERQQFTKMGVAGVIVKPFDPMRLVEEIVTVFHW
jgi:CheY-like chemotaxis protein